MTIDLDRLTAILEAHRKWLYGEDGGARADLRGADLRGADLRGADLHGANLDGANLVGANLRNANLRGATLRDADLDGANLVGANLRGAHLVGANLRNANLRGAHLPALVVVRDLDRAILAAIERGGVLDMAAWHGQPDAQEDGCGTTHCRAGWAIALAGEAGRVLEDIYGPQVAGALIYAASRPDKPVPDFFASTAIAMESIRADAA